MTHIEELIKMNKLLKDLIERKDLSEKMYDLKCIKDIVKDLKDEDFEVKLVLTDEAADLFNSLFEEKKEKSKPEDVRKETKDKVQGLLNTKGKEPDDAFPVYFTRDELSALLSLLYGNIYSVLDSEKTAKNIKSAAEKIRKAFVDSGFI